MTTPESFRADVETFVREWNDPEPTLVVHTSGSTGAPQPLRVEKTRMAASARITCDFLGLRPGDSALLCMPLDFIAGKMVVVRALTRGLRLIAVPPSAHPLAGLDETPDFAAMVPSQVYETLRVPAEADRLRRIRQLIIGGGAVDEALQAKLAGFPHAVWSTYGMTETLSHVALRRLNGPDASAWYSPFPGVSLDVNADGCLVIDAPAVHAGRLVTRDIAELREDGRFRILGRRDNTICSGGVKIQLEDVEARLRPSLHVPFVATAVGDAKYGEALTLLVQSPAPPVDELQRLCAASLPPYHRPKHYLQVNQLPTTGSGKPARKTARQLAEQLLKTAEKSSLT